MRDVQLAVGFPRSRGRLALGCVAVTNRRLPDNEAASFISKHSVGLLLPNQSWAGGVRPVGSGSLVTFDGRYFILTATHVWAELESSAIVYYTEIGEIPHAACLHRESLTATSLADNLIREPGPFDADLTLLGLHRADSRKMGARLSFFPLVREGSGSMDDWVLVGIPGVLAHRDPAQINTLLFELRAIFVATLADEERDGLDFLKSRPFPDPLSPIKDYRGLSGGGLWSVQYYPEKMADERYNVFLIGVNFYQAAEEIRSLGGKAIKKLVQKVRGGATMPI